MNLTNLFQTAKPIIGMLHLPALPGSPAHALSLREIRERLLRDAEALAAGGIDGFILENYGDLPFYPRRVPPHTVAFMAALARDVRIAFSLPLGVNMLRNDAIGALAVAAAAEAAFLRVNVFTGARLTDQGIIEGEAHKISRYRKLLGSSALLFADVAVKHSSSLGGGDLRDEVSDAIHRGGADALVVSGAATGKETRLVDIREVREAAGDTPVLVGSGVTVENGPGMLAHADGLIVGTALKVDGVTHNPVDPERVRTLVESARRIRRNSMR